MTLLEQLLETAKRPGLMGIAGMAMERRAKADLKRYFQQLRTAVLKQNLEQLVTEPTVLARHGVELKMHNVTRKLSSDLLATLKVNLEEAYTRGWKLTQIHEADDDPFPPIGPDQLGDTGQAAADYAAEHAGELVTGLNDTTTKLLQDAVEQGIVEQLGVGGTAALIRGLTDDMTKERAETIATTEMNDAFSQATMDKLDFLGIGYVKWLAEDDACDECDSNDGVVVAIGEMFPSGDVRTPAHPNCRCAIVGARSPE